MASWDPGSGHARAVTGLRGSLRAVRRPLAPAVAHPRALLGVFAVVVLATAACGSAGEGAGPAATRPPIPPVPASTAPAAAGEVVRLVPEVLAVYPHDDGSYTQGLVVDPQGRVFESAGRYGRSDVREVDVASGRVLRRRDLPDDVFAEGLALLDGRLVVLTWKEGRAFVLDASSLEPVGEHAYDGQGWGLCFDGERLVMSDGSATLTFRDPGTFAVRGSVTVTSGGAPLPRLNELDCVDGTVWANVYLTDRIVQIDPVSGRVLAEVDAAALSARQEGLEADEVLNGIAWDPERGTFLVTGKHWDALYEVRFVAA